MTRKFARFPLCTDILSFYANFSGFSAYSHQFPAILTNFLASFKAHFQENEDFLPSIKSSISYSEAFVLSFILLLSTISIGFNIVAIYIHFSFFLFFSFSAFIHGMCSVCLMNKYWIISSDLLLNVFMKKFVFHHVYLYMSVAL